MASGLIRSAVTERRYKSALSVERSRRQPTSTFVCVACVAVDDMYHMQQQEVPAASVTHTGHLELYVKAETRWRQQQPKQPAACAKRRLTMSTSEIVPMSPANQFALANT